MNWEEYRANVKNTEYELEQQVKWLKRLSTEFTGSTERHVQAAIRKVEEAVEELWTAADD